MTKHKLSLLSAILININIMLGAGLFINTVLLAQNSQALSPVTYLIVAALVFPLILSMTQLLKCHVGGNFYDFAHSIHPYAGFISIWSYFTTKLASATLGIHVFVSLMQRIFPLLAFLNTIAVDCGIITLFVLLNMLNLKIGRSIQYSFIMLKLIPILFAILSGIFLFSGAHFNPEYFIIDGLLVSIPFALYSFTGFEATCSLASSLHNPEKNGPRAILISFCIVTLIVFLYQFMFVGSLGIKLGFLNSYLEAFPTLVNQLFPDYLFKKEALIGILHIGIASSSLGAAYGIIYSNNWNLYSMAQRNLTFAKGLFTSMNRHHIPTACVIAEGLLAYSYILLTQGNQIPLQQLVSLGNTVAYSLSSVGLLVYLKKTQGRFSLISCLGVASCGLLLFAVIKNFVQFGVHSLLGFAIIFTFGSLMYFLTNFQQQQSHQA